MTQDAHIDLYGEIVWHKDLGERVKQEKGLDSLHDWILKRRVSQPLSLESIQQIAEAAKRLDVRVLDNSDYSLSLSNPQGLVDYFHFKRLEMSRAEAFRGRFPRSLKAEPSDFIKAGIRYAIHVRKCFIADPDRESRMSIAIAAAHQVEGYPCLLVCRKQEVDLWLDILDRWLPNSVALFTVDTLPWESFKKGIVLVEYTELEKYSDRLSKIKFWSAIVDHSEMIKNPNARRTRLVSKLVHRPNYVFLTTDFPVSLQVSDLLEPLSIIGKKREFEELIVYLKDALPDPLLQGGAFREQRMLRRLHTTLRSTCMVRRGDDLGLQVQERVELIPLSADLPEGFEAAWFKSPIHWLGAHKVLGALDWLKKYRAVHAEKFVVVTHHQRVGAEIASQLGADLLYGGIANSAQRDEVVRRFLEEDDQVLVLAKDVEMDLTWDFRSIRTIVFVEPPFSPRELKKILSAFQDEKNPASLTAYYLCTNHSMDLDAMARLDLRLQRMRAVLDVEDRA
jgi:hypothetical protein